MTARKLCPFVFELLGVFFGDGGSIGSSVGADALGVIIEMVMVIGCF